MKFPLRNREIKSICVHLLECCKAYMHFIFPSDDTTAITVIKELRKQRHNQGSRCEKRCGALLPSISVVDIPVVNKTNQYVQSLPFFFNFFCPCI